MATIYKNAIERMTIDMALRLYHEHDICVVIDEGKHVTLVDED